MASLVWFIYSIQDNFYGSDDNYSLPKMPVNALFLNKIKCFDSMCTSTSIRTLLYKVPSNSTGENFVTKVYCFYLQNL